MGKGKPIPKFASEAEERAFWEDPSNDMEDYFDPAGERRYDDYTSPPTRAISLRLTVPMIEDLKRLGGERDIPYQTLIKMYLGDRIDEELGRGRFAPKKRKAG
jgi:predicted DNA binding CopG/RHH family protein